MVRALTFTFIKKTVGNYSLLKREGNEPVAKPVAICVGKRKAGAVVETIGAVREPRFLALLEGSWPVGTEFDVCKNR